MKEFPSATSTRYEYIDVLRGIAIVLMIVFHLNYSLVHIFWIEFLNLSEIFWYILWNISALGFIFISGISFFLAEKKYGKGILKKYWKYSMILVVLAGMISFITYFFFPEEYIRFGILHFFALSFFLLPFFSIFRYLNGLIWISIIIYGVLFIPIVENKYLFFLWFTYPWFSSSDYYPLFPYFWVLLLGYILGLFLQKQGKFSIFHKVGESNSLEIALEYIWKKSLLVYLIHQPIIIAVIGLVDYIFSK